jgi:hypothetical protein
VRLRHFGMHWILQLSLEELEDLEEILLTASRSDADFTTRESELLNALQQAITEKLG